MGFELTLAPTETIKLLAQYLDYITKTNDKRIGNNRKATRFHAKSIPSIDILGYLNRILKYSPCSTECFLAILIYLRRISVNGQLIYSSSEVDDLQIRLQNTKLTASSNTKIIVDSYNIHRLVITSVLLSIKFLSDVFYTNLHVSRVGGVSVQELNQLEVEFLRMSDFSLMISPEELIECGETLLAFCMSPRSSLNTRSSLLKAPNDEQSVSTEFKGAVSDQTSRVGHTKQIDTSSAVVVGTEHQVANPIVHQTYQMNLALKVARNKPRTVFKRPVQHLVSNDLGVSSPMGISSVVTTHHPIIYQSFQDQVCITRKLARIRPSTAIRGRSGIMTQTRVPIYSNDSFPILRRRTTPRKNRRGISKRVSIGIRSVRYQKRKHQCKEPFCPLCQFT